MIPRELCRPEKHVKPYITTQRHFYESTCRLQEDEETSVAGSDSEEKEEEVQQPILALGGRRMPFEGYPEITW